LRSVNFRNSPAFLPCRILSSAPPLAHCSTSIWRTYAALLALGAGGVRFLFWGFFLASKSFLRALVLERSAAGFFPWFGSLFNSLHVPSFRRAYSILTTFLKIFIDFIIFQVRCSYISIGVNLLAGGKCGEFGQTAFFCAEGSLAPLFPSDVKTLAIHWITVSV